LSRNIFPQTAWYNPYGWTSPVWTHQYSEIPLEKELIRIFENKTLRHITSVKTAITSVNLRNHELKLFRNYDSFDPNDLSENFFIRDVARATSAAPSYFPMMKINPIDIHHNHLTGIEFPLVDGGVGANNPSHIALAEAYQQYGYGPVNLISLGCGKENGTHAVQEYPYIERGGPTIDLVFN
jgi:patatin-like phospholipase/acyl hydrolase